MLSGVPAKRTSRPAQRSKAISPFASIEIRSESSIWGRRPRGIVVPSYLLLAPSETFTALIRVTDARTDIDNAIHAGLGKVFAIGGISCHEPHRAAGLAEHSQGNDRSRNCSVVELGETIELEH
jgi:hypothetical protein